MVNDASESEPGETKPLPGEDSQPEFGSHPQDGVGSVVHPDNAKEFATASKTRAYLGIAFFGLGTASIGLAIVATYFGIDRVALPSHDASDRTVAILKVTGHTIASLALVLFGYALIRAGERMFVPRWLLKGDPKDVEIIKAILGNDTPLASALKLTEKVGDTIGKVVEPIARAVKRDE